MKNYKQMHQQFAKHIHDVAYADVIGLHAYTTMPSSLYTATIIQFLRNATDVDVTVRHAYNTMSSSLYTATKTSKFSESVSHTPSTVCHCLMLSFSVLVCSCLRWKRAVNDVQDVQAGLADAFTATAQTFGSGSLPTCVKCRIILFKRTSALHEVPAFGANCMCLQASWVPARASCPWPSAVNPASNSQLLNCPLLAFGPPAPDVASANRRFISMRNFWKSHSCNE